MSVTVMIPMNQTRPAQPNQAIFLHHPCRPQAAGSARVSVITVGESELGSTGLGGSSDEIEFDEEEILQVGRGLGVWI